MRVEVEVVYVPLDYNLLLGRNWIYAIKAIISFHSRKKCCVALSTAEAEYVSACSASCEVVWLRKLLSDLFDIQMDATCLHCNNQSCIKLSKNLVFHENSKHNKIKYHYIKDIV